MEKAVNAATRLPEVELREAAPDITETLCATTIPRILGWCRRRPSHRRKSPELARKCTAKSTARITTEDSAEEARRAMVAAAEEAATAAVVADRNAVGPEVEDLIIRELVGQCSLTIPV